MKVIPQWNLPLKGKVEERADTGNHGEILAPLWARANSGQPAPDNFSLDRGIIVKRSSKGPNAPSGKRGKQSVGAEQGVNL